MIYEAMSCIVNELNQHVNSKVGLSEDKIVMSSLVNPDGTVPIEIKNKLVCSMVYVGKEGVHGGLGGSGGGSTSFASPSAASGKGGTKLNLYIMFSAHFDDRNYEEALKFLSYVISYLSMKSVFNTQNSDLDARLGQLELHVAKMTFTEINNVWAYMGAKYQPSIVYHCRYITFDDEYIDAVNSTVRGLGLGSKLR